ncbi:MAG TPA: type II toxin-antitoxin system MqsA family antitoxin [Planctomycetota bacterium]|nr:type II toxin-antitoxin system MqsA family antitoxin [Planctomycetota bacterium]
MPINRRPTLVCGVCGAAGAWVRHAPRSYGKGNALLVIEDVPVVFCAHCGESYLTAETLRRIEEIKKKRSRIASRRSVTVAHLP